MKELIELIAKSLVDKPEMVEVNEITNNTSVVLELKVAPDDMGKVIGKQGKIAKAIRTLAKAAATKEGVKVTVEISR
ncbi:MAG: KH domain-containing protein [Syntrophomonadaceae bacterium]|nr:KH domain-containing protein [Syntrophomonadaceae bacterium]